MLAGSAYPAMPPVAVTDPAAAKPGNEDHPEGMLQHRIRIRGQRGPARHRNSPVVVVDGGTTQEIGADQRVIIEKVENFTNCLGRCPVALAAGVAPFGNEYLNLVRRIRHSRQPFQRLDIPPGFTGMMIENLITVHSRKKAGDPGFLS